MTEFATAADGLPDPVATEIRALLAEPRRGSGPGDPVAAAYARRGYRPAWQDDGRLGALVARLEAAGEEGLRPADYDVAGLRMLLGRTAGDPRDAAVRDVRATGALASYLRDMRGGRLDPATLEPAGWAALGPATLAAALDGADPGVLATPAAPVREAYATLRAAYARYRHLAEGGGWPALPQGPTLDPGGRDPRVPALRERLARSADLPPGYAPPGDPAHFDAPLVAALAAVQARYGLEADGRLGRSTVQALNVPAATRAGQLRAALERLRWFPAETGPTWVQVNVPAFRATVWIGGARAWEGRVIVGRPGRPTPVLEARIVGLLLNPSWTVPPTILREDILPEVRRDPAYLDREGLQVVARGGAVVPPASVDWSRPLAAQRLTVVQPPGPKNPLGRLKFLSPNTRDVYLHDTPVQRLFARTSRAFSSGCIRIEDPLRVAELLIDDPSLRAADLADRIAAGGSPRIPLPRPVPLRVVYWTAEVAPDGSVRFYRDLYDEDAPLLAALDGRPPAPAPARQAGP